MDQPIDMVQYELKMLLREDYVEVICQCVLFVLKWNLAERAMLDVLSAASGDGAENY